MKTAIITGVSGNLGQAVARKFLSENYRVTGTVIPNDPAKISIDSAYFKTAVADLMNEASAEEFVKNVMAESKQIHAAILTVGGFAMGKVTETRIADVQKQYKLNFETAYNIARPVFTHMMEQGTGRIFLVGSRPGSDMRFGKGMTAYSLAKSLVFRLAELMNEEAKGKDVVTSVIVPSTIDTPENRKSMPDADFGKWVKPEAIADAIHFYCSEKGSVLREPVIKVYGNS